jgi:hypothetical protein
LVNFVDNVCPDRVSEREHEWLFDGPLQILYFLFGSEILDDKPLQVKSNTGKIFKIDSSMKPMNHLTAPTASLDPPFKKCDFCK